MEIPQKLKVELLYDPAIPLLGICLKNPKTIIQKNISTPIIIAALFTIAKIWKQPKCPSVDEKINNHGTFTQWNTAQPQKRRKLYALRQYGWTW